MKIAAYIILNILLYSSWYGLLYRMKHDLKPVDRLIGAFILGLSQIIATQMVLGVIFQNLFPQPLFLMNISISLSIWVWEIKSGVKGMVNELLEEGRELFLVIRGDWVLSLLSLLVISVIGWVIFITYLFPSYTWDALYYHLPIVGQIMQSGAIQENPTVSFIQQYMNIFSKNINLFFIWNIIFLESDVIVDLSQLFFTVAGAMSVYSMSIKMKVREKYALYGAFLFFLTPMIVMQSSANYVDAAVSMLFLISLNFLLNELPGASISSGGTASGLRRGRAHLILSGLSAGILLGSKPSGPIFIAMLCGALLLLPLFKRYEGELTSFSFRKEVGSYFLCIGVPVCLMGGYWYARNWLFYGNPVYFMDISLFGHVIMKGLEQTWVEGEPPVIEGLNYLAKLFYVWRENVGYYMYDSRFSGFGPVWFILFVPAMLFAFIHALRRKNLAFLFVSIIIGLTFIVHPRNWTARYVVFVVGLGAVSFVQVFDYFRKREDILRGMVLVLALYTVLTLNTPCIMPGKIQEFLSLPASERTLANHKPFNLDEKVREEYGIWIWMDNNLKSGDTLAYTFEKMTLDEFDPFFIAPLWNSQFSNRVVHLTAPSYNEWLHDLEQNTTTYVLTLRDSKEDRWMEKERKRYYAMRWMGNVKEKFRVLYADDTYRILSYHPLRKAEHDGQ